MRAPRHHPPTAHTPWDTTSRVGYPVDDVARQLLPPNPQRSTALVTVCVEQEASMQVAIAEMTGRPAGFDCPAD